MALLHRRTRIHEAVHLDNWHLTHCLWGWNRNLLLLSSLLLRRRCLRDIQYFQHHLFHLVDTKDPIQRRYVAAGYGRRQKLRARLSC